jgi:hypothetical protein
MHYSSIKELKKNYNNRRRARARQEFLAKARGVLANAILTAAGFALGSFLVGMVVIAWIMGQAYWPY